VLRVKSGFAGPCRSLNIKCSMLCLRPILRSSLLISARHPRLVASYANERLAAATDADDSSPPTSSKFPRSNPIPKKPKPEVKPSVQKPRYQLHVFSSKNNTIATFTTPQGNTKFWCTAGSVGFKKSQRSGYEAGYQCAVHIFRKIEDYITREGSLEIHLFFKGYGQGRDALQRAMQTTEGDRIRPLIVQLTDRTPIKIGGTRAKKTRRL
jgi:small subunit ribosomal protein S11